MINLQKYHTEYPHYPAAASRPEYLPGFLSALLFCLCIAVTANAQTDNRWTGDGDGISWADGDNWSLGVPQLSHRVIFGNDAENEAQTITLSADTQVDLILFEATGNRNYTLQSQNDAELRVTQSTNQLIVHAGATADLTLNLAYYGSFGASGGAANSRLYNDSATSRLIIGPDGTWNAAGDAMPYGTGTFILQGRILRTYRPLVGGPVSLIVDPADTSVGSFTNQFFPNVASNLYLANDVLLDNNRWRGSGDTYIGTYGEDSPDRSLSATTAGGGIRYNASADIIIVPNPVDGSGNVTVQISYWDSGTFQAGQVVTIPGSTVQLGGTGPRVMDGSLEPGISGGGNMHLLDDQTSDVFSMQRAITLSGRTMIERGTLRMDESDPFDVNEVPHTSHGLLSPTSIIEIGEDGVLNLNGFNQTIGGLTGFTGKQQDQAQTFGSVLMGGAVLTIDAAQASSFGGNLDGDGDLIKTGSASFTLTDDFVMESGRNLTVEQGLLAVEGLLGVVNGTLTLSGGQIEADALVADDITWEVILQAANENQNLVSAASFADITGATLDLSLGDAYIPGVGTSFTVLTADMIFGAMQGGDLFQYTDGEEFFVGGVEFRIDWVSNSENIVLTVIPETRLYASLLGLLCVFAVWQSRRSRPQAV